jgi:hypothetical protein
MTARETAHNSPDDAHHLLVMVILAWALMTVPAFWVMPAWDDWSASTPISAFSWHLLLPDLNLWRPLQHLFRVAAFSFPYPGFAHLMNALGHLAAVGLVSILARQCGGSRRSSLLAALAYALAPAVGAAVWSVDSENQVWSNVFGLASAAVLIRSGKSRAGSYVAWLILATVSVLWNEGGIAWFAAAPLLKAFARSKQEASPRQIYVRCGVELAMGFVGVAVYFMSRFVLLGKISLGVPGERYGVSLNPITFAKHAAMIVGMAMSTVDTLALLSPRPTIWLALSTLVLGVPSLVIFLGRARRSWTVHQWLLAACVTLVVVSPFCVMAHVSEMYAQRAAAVLAIMLIGAGLPHEGAVSASRLERMAPMLAPLAIVACLVGNAHKLEAMVELGKSSAVVGSKVADIIGRDVPDSICVACQRPTEKASYSVYEMPPGMASNCGLAGRMHWGWQRRITFEIVTTPDGCRGKDPAIEVTLNGQVRRLW